MNNNAYNEFANQILSHYQHGFSLNPMNFHKGSFCFAISTTLTVDQQNSLGNYGASRTSYSYY